MARFTHPAISSYGSTESGTWVIDGGTMGNLAAQPVFDGDPLFSGEWTRIGDFCHFSIDVDFDNILDFGSTQYFVRLPFPASKNYLLSDGCIHDISTGNQYAILGHVVAGSDVLELFSIASNGRQVFFESNTPFTLSTADNFHIAGSYRVDPTV
jgi:hypothetical protein